jgi:hypothetical protein
MEATYTGRMTYKICDAIHYAEVVIRAEPCCGAREITLSAPVFETLRVFFGVDAPYYEHCVTAGIKTQIAIANVAKELPFVGASEFQVEVLVVSVSENAGRESSGFLLTVAAMRAIGAYLCDWEQHVRSSIQSQ